jgi:methenyltetrahydrofolate cyclohydrolase
VTLDDFLDGLAARTPTPGGGGAAAVTGAMAAGLVAMAARFSAARLPGALDLAEQADELRRRAAELAEADALAYAAVLDARRQGGDLREALAGAAVVPLEIAEIGARVAQMAARVASAGNPNLRGDAVTGALLATASARSAACLVDINVGLGGLEPELSRRAARAVTDACAAAERVMTERTRDESVHAGPSSGAASRDEK